MLVRTGFVMLTFYLAYSAFPAGNSNSNHYPDKFGHVSTSFAGSRKLMQNVEDSASVDTSDGSVSFPDEHVTSG